jgi:hypothetical protein
MDERSEDALATGRFDAEEARRLGQRELESRHFLKFRLNPREQIMRLMVFDRSGVRALFRGRGHGLTPREYQLVCSGIDRSPQ